MKLCLATGSRTAVILMCVTHTVFHQATSHTDRERQQEFSEQGGFEIFRHKRSADGDSKFTTSRVTARSTGGVLTSGVKLDHPRTKFMENSSTVWTSDKNLTENDLIFASTNSIAHSDVLPTEATEHSNVTTTSDVRIDNDTTTGDNPTVTMTTSTNGNQDELWPLKTWETFGLIAGIVVGAMVILSLLIIIIPRRKSKKNTEVEMENIAADQPFEDKGMHLINPTFNISPFEASSAVTALGQTQSVTTIDRGLPASVSSRGDGHDNLYFSNELTDYYKLQEARMQNDGTSEPFYERVDLFKQPPKTTRRNNISNNSVYDSPTVPKERYAAPQPNTGQENVYNTLVPSIIPTVSVYDNDSVSLTSGSTVLGSRRVAGVNNMNISQCPPSPRLVGRLRGDYSHLPPYPPSPEIPSFTLHKQSQGVTNPISNRPAVAFPRNVREQPPFVADRTMTQIPGPENSEMTARNFLKAPNSGNLAVNTPRTVKKAYDELKNVLDDIPNELFED